ncbi:uncharacterized protein PHALS_03941 [Plasmopara halstedii]|uniref:Uncharacterized protein n=1 Tax=Plasmopara halstedii TaxID=4781 RepID=A0A0N7L3T0_PLAHL|nr:uncharacterized protein PHALS_03941 [Plasmopara halstedii]CEG36731.1 hypothetical protein PHALS_03941 [Plasmopara halstedii]|eukprot:XP_024573100.1 hypothetical protein PHALS_03941 [Plasmopara halstedii]
MTGINLSKEEVGRKSAGNSAIAFSWDVIGLSKQIKLKQFRQNKRPMEKDNLSAELDQVSSVNVG